MRNAHPVAVAAATAGGTQTPPAWVLQAWEVHQKMVALFRIVAANVPPEAMQVITPLPQHWQLIALQVLLLSSGNYNNAVLFLQNFRDLVMAMPLPPAASLPLPLSAAGSGRPLVVFHMGHTSGQELHTLLLVVEWLKDNGISVHLASVTFITPGETWQPVIDEIIANQRGNVPTVGRLNVSDALAAVPASAQAWQQTQAVVVAVMVLPPPHRKLIQPFAQVPGHHASGSRDLWGYIIVLKALAACVRLGVLVLADTDTATEPSTGEFLTKHFGQARLVPSNDLRVPLKAWTLRVCPVATKPLVLVGRTGPIGTVEGVAAHLKAASEKPAPFNAVLPSLAALEAVLDKQLGGETLTPQEANTISLLLRRDAAGAVATPHRLLDRCTLVALLGIQGWRIVDCWRERMPCCQHVHPYTGQPAQAGSAGSALCGQLRYCTACAQFYECMTSSPSPFVYASGLSLAIRESMEPETTVPNVDLQGLPSHHCVEGCTGQVA